MSQQQSLEAEIAYRIKNGARQVSLGEFEESMAQLGYRLDRSMDCRGVSRYMTGPEAGRTYPELGLYPRQSDDGLSAFHVSARRDAQYKALVRMREEFFFVSRGAIASI